MQNFKTVAQALLGETAHFGFCPPKIGLIEGVGGVPEIFFFIGIFLFLWVTSHAAKLYNIELKNWQKIIWNWKDDTSLVEGASPPPSNGTTYGWGKIGSEQVVLTGRKPLCGKARPDDPIGSRWVTEVGGEANPGTGQGVGSVCLLYTSPSPRD